MDNTVETLTIKGVWDGKNVTQGLNNMVSTIQSGVKSLLTSAIMPMVTALASGKFLQDFATEMEQIDRTSKSLKMSAEDLYAWRNAAEIAGVGANEMTGALKSLQGQMRNTAMSRTGSIANWQRRGILPDVLDTNGALKDTETYLLEVADALSKLPADKAAIVAREIGLGNEAMQEFLSKGSAGIQKQLARGKELASISQKSVKFAKDMLKALRELGVALKGVMIPIFNIVTPLIKKIADFAILAATHTKVFAFAIAGLAAVVTAKGIPAFLKFFATLMANPVFWVISALVALGAILEDIYVWANGGESAFGDLYDNIFGGVEQIQELIKWLNYLFNTPWDELDFNKLFNVNTDKIMANVEEVIKLIFGKFLPAMADLVADLVVKVIQSLPEILWGLVKAMAGGALTIAKGVAAGIGIASVRPGAEHSLEQEELKEYMTENRTANIVINGVATDKQIAQAKELGKDFSGTDNAHITNQAAGAMK